MRWPRATWPLNPQTLQKKQKTRKKRWPFGPPHLTLKPSKKEKTKKITKKKNPKKQKWAFQLSANFFFGGGPKCPLFDNLAKKARTPKRHYRNWGFSTPIFWKADVCHETAIFGDKKNPKPEIPVIIFVCFSFSFNNKNTNICWNPIIL